MKKATKSKSRQLYQKDLAATKKAVTLLGKAVIPTDKQVVKAVRALVTMPNYEGHRNPVCDGICAILEPFLSLMFDAGGELPAKDLPQPENPKWRKRVAAQIRRLHKTLGKQKIPAKEFALLDVELEQLRRE